MFLQFIYIFVSGVFYLGAGSWERSGDGGGLAALILTVWFLCVHAVFFFIQLLVYFAETINFVKTKKYIFIFHNLCLFGYHFYIEIHRSMTWNNEIKVWKTSPWLFYIPLFILVSSCIYICLMNYLEKKWVSYK